MHQAVTSLRNGVNVVIIGRINLTIIGQSSEGCIEVSLAQVCLHDVPDVALVDELIRFGDLLHHFEDDLLAVTSMLVETRVHPSCIVRCTSAHPRASCCSIEATLGLLTHKCTVGKDTFLADAVSNEDLEKMVCDFIELLNLLDMSSNDGLLFLKDSNRTINFDVHEFSKHCGKSLIRENKMAQTGCFTYWYSKFLRAMGTSFSPFW